MNRAFEFFEKDKAPEWEPRNEYFEFYQKLNALKHSRRELAAGVEGGELVSYPAVSPDIYAFSREKDGSKIVVLTNLGAENTDVKFKGDAPAVDGMTDYFTGAAAAIPASLAPGEYLVFVSK